MRTSHSLARAVLLILPFALHSFADDRYIVRAQPSVIDSVARQHKLKVEKKLRNEGVYLVSLPQELPPTAVVQAMKANPSIQSVEANANLKVPEAGGSSYRGKRQVTRLYGGAPSIPMTGRPWAPYANQPATSAIRIQDAQKHFGYGHSGVQVGVIDTGVDFEHPALKPVLNTVDARSFVSGIGPATTHQETTPFVDQETTPFVDGLGAVVLHQETTPFVDQETTPFVDQETTPFVDGKAWGHGTMVAGLIHLVAPNVRILPLRAFRSDGSGSMADVIAAIDYAVSLGNVQVLNMSFSASETSVELNRAIAAATKAGMICVASVANDNSPAVVYPSNIDPVTGVAATTNDAYRASFSNYGPDAQIAAPGVEVVSTYPNNRYATVSGTSFSTAWVSGTVALMRSVNRTETVQQAQEDLDAGASRVKSPELHAGQLDVFKSVNKARSKQDRQSETGMGPAGPILF